VGCNFITWMEESQRLLALKICLVLPLPGSRAASVPHAKNSELAPRRRTVLCHEPCLFCNVTGLALQLVLELFVPLRSKVCDLLACLLSAPNIRNVLSG